MDDRGTQQATDPIVLTIGDIGVTRHWVATPNGSAPLMDSQWIARDATREEMRIPPYAIVLAIVFALACLLGLLFLLIKEKRTVGYVEVTVTSGSLRYMTQVPANGPGDVARIRQLVGEAQSMAATAASAARPEPLIAPQSPAGWRGGTVTVEDVLRLVEAIRDKDNAQVSRGLQKVGSRDDNVLVVLQALRIFGQVVRSKADETDLVPIVERCINTSPREKSEAARSAINELGRALFLDGASETITAIALAQGRDTRLTEEERSENLLNLVYAAGWISQQTGV